MEYADEEGPISPCHKLASYGRVSHLRKPNRRRLRAGVLVSQYCAACHNENLKSGGLSWSDVDLAHPERNADRLEKVIKKVRAGMMSPGKARRGPMPKR